MKELLKSKSFWNGIAMVGLGAYQCFSGNKESGIASIQLSHS